MKGLKEDQREEKYSWRGRNQESTDSDRASVVEETVMSIR